MSEKALIVLLPEESGRCGQTVRRALADLAAEYRPLGAPGELRGRRVLFAVPLPEDGISLPLLSLLSALRRTPGMLDGCTGGVVVDGTGERYTKSAARELVLAANDAGCRFVGRPLAEATGSLRNFAVQARNRASSLEEAYAGAVRELAVRVAEFAPPRSALPRLTVLHASSRATSNTLALWGLVRETLSGRCEITEIGLRNGALQDCAGCSYTACLHFGEQGKCFYGGVMVEQVYPAVRACDGLLLLCPNYNDALAANLTACINRLTALYRTVPLSGKALFGIIVSGYSGGDLVAEQLVSALCMNKGFWLPPRFCMLETANDAGEAVRLPGIRERAGAFANRICGALNAPVLQQNR